MILDKIYETSIRFMQVGAPSANDVGLPTVAADQGTAQTLLTIVLGALAAAAILVIIISAFNIVTGDGDPEKISRGKKGVIYALVGLLVVLSAEVIVQFVLNGI